METPFEASNVKTSEIAGKMTVADVFAPGDEEMFCGTSFAAMQNEHNRNSDNQNPAVSEMLSGCYLVGANSGDSASPAPEAGPITKTDDGMDVGRIAESVTEAVMSPGGREAFETYASGKHGDWRAPENLRIQLQNSGLAEWEARAMITHLDRMMRSGVDFTSLVNLPRQDFERHLRDRLNGHVNRTNS